MKSHHTNYGGGGGALLVPGAAVAGAVGQSAGTAGRRPPLLCGGATIAAESPFYDFTFFVKATRQQNVDNFFPALYCSRSFKA